MKFTYSGEKMDIRVHHEGKEIGHMSCVEYDPFEDGSGVWVKFDFICSGWIIFSDKTCVCFEFEDVRTTIIASFECRIFILEEFFKRMGKNI